jgi:hypothetical protein
MKYQKEIEKVIEELKRRGIEVTLLDDAEEGIEIGELKNGRITINTRARDAENLLFTLGHLFGHYVQFNNYDKYKHLIERVDEPKPLKNITQKFRDEFWEYEKEAFRIGKGLIMCVTEMPEELERKFEIFMNADYEFFFKFLETGKNITPEGLKRVLKERYADANITFDKYLEPIYVDDNLKIDPGMYVHVY